jgi:hypothetical protein
MAEPLKLKTNHKPSIFNSDMTLGVLLAAVTPLGLVGGSLLAGFALMGAVGLAGGLIGKARMVRENAEGKIVAAPTRMNKEAALGGLAGMILGGLAGAMTAVGVALLATMATGGGAAPGLAVLGALMTPAMLAGHAIGGIAGAVMGGGYGKKRMAREYEAAVEQQMAERRQAARGIGQEQQPAMAEEITRPRSFVEALQQSRTEPSQRER